MPKHVRLISLLVVCSLWSMPKAAHAQALVPHTLQLDVASLEKQGLSLAQEAAQLAQFRKFDLALPQARLATQLAPKNDKVWLLLGRLHLQNNDIEAGISALKKAQSLNPKNVDVIDKEGLSLAQEAAQLAQFQELDLALTRAQLATQLSPKNDKVWFLLGGLHLQTKEFDAAIAALSKAQTLNPKNADVLFALGSVNFQQKNYPVAIANYQAGLKLKPNDPEGLFDLGNAFFVSGRLPDAIAQFTKAVSQDKKFWPAINNIGLINYEQGNIPEAIKQWQTAVKLDQQAAEPLLALAVALYTKGDRQQGLAMGVSALRIDQRYGDLDFLKENLWGDRLLGDTKKFLELPRIQAALEQSPEISAPDQSPTP